MLCQYGKMEVLNHTSLVSKYVSNQQVVVSVNISRFYQVFQVSKLTTTGEFVTYVTSPELQVTSSTAQGGGGSFKNRKRIGEIDCCE